MVARGLSLIVALFAFWLLLSGHYTLWLMSLGLISAIAITVFATRLTTLDQEGHPIEFITGAVTYWPWLVWEIVKAAIDVTKQILSPHMKITPTMARVTATQHTAVGLTTYANSITLTPGTISTTVSMEKRTILVHALMRDGVESLAEGDMDRRVTRFEGNR